MPFAKLGLIEPLVQAVAANGYTAPTDIQLQAMPPAIAGRDVLGCAQTGTGKTAAFALPILHRLHTTDAGRRRGGGRPIRALVLSPTRELAAQIGDSFNAYRRNTRLRHTVIYGGVKQHAQVRALHQGVDILVATPGRLLDLLNQGVMTLEDVEILVLDEADRMLDMGFIHDIRRVISLIPDQRQTLLFSATMPREIRQLADTILNNPVTVTIAAQSAAADTVEQVLYHVDRTVKCDLLQSLLTDPMMERTIVFARTKRGADRIARRLNRVDIAAEAIHSDKSQGARLRALDNFKRGRTRVLVASDIAARGLDVDSITHVVNYDLPNDAETYVHRIGRTGRAGAEGQAISFCDGEERSNLRDIERLLKRPLPVLDHDFVARPRPDHPGGHPSGSRPHRQKRSTTPRTIHPLAAASAPAKTKRSRKRRRKNVAAQTNASHAGQPAARPSGKRRPRRRKG